MEIVIPLFDRFEPLDAIGPYEVLAHIPDATVRWVAPQAGPVTDTFGAMTIAVDTRYDDIESCDVLLVPGGAGVGSLRGDTAFIEWLRHIHSTTTYTTSVCTGSLLLATAGLLTGLHATTHWASADILESLGARYTPQRIVPQGKIVTSAGVSSGIDMALELAARLSDDVTAQAIQLALEYDPQPPFDYGSVAKAPEAVYERAMSFWSD
jgi:putative intracellular protease/amidase